MALTPTQKAQERADGHKSIFYLSVCQSVTLLTCQVDGALSRGTTSIPVDNGTSIDLTRIREGMVVSVVTTTGTYKVRLVSATLAGANPAIAGTLVVDNNSIPWGDNNDLTISEMFEPMIIPPTFDAETGVSTKRGETFANQTLQPGPGNKMGGHRAKFLAGGSPAVFTLNASATVMTPDASISSYQWLSTIGTITDPNAQNTTLTANAAGEGWVYCTATDSNGKAHTGVRHVWAHDEDPLDADYPYNDFEVGSPSLSFDGSFRVPIKVSGVADFSKFVDGALVVVWRRAWFDATEGVISEIANEEANQLFAGYIVKDSIQMDAIYGLVTFEALALPDVMKTLSMQALSIHAEATVQYWFQMPTFMTMKHMLYWLIYWHSNLLEIADWTFPESTIKKKLFSFNEGNLFSQVSDCASKLLAKCGCNWAGQMFVEQDIQLLPTDAERAAVAVVSDITPADWRGQAMFIRRHYGTVAAVEIKAFAFDGTNITAYCSAAPGKVRAGHGSTKTYDGLMVTDQTHANQLAGRLFAADNNEYEEVRLSFSGDYSVACPFPQRWWTIDVAAADTLRGIVESDMRMAPRTVSLQIDAKNGVLLVDAIFEPETFGPDGISKACASTGDVSEEAEPSWPEPVGESSSTLAALLSFGTVEYRADGEDAWSVWENVLVCNHGAVDKFWRQKQATADPSKAIAWEVGEAAISQVYADQLIDRTPQADPPNSWDDDPAPTVGSVSFIQHVSSLFTSGRHYVLGRWSNGSNWRGWILLLTSDGQAATWNTLFVAADTDTLPLMLAEDGQDGSRLYLTVWRAGTLYLERWSTSSWTRQLQTSLGTATLAEVLARTWWAGVAAAPGDGNRLYVFGRMNAPGGLTGTRQVIKSKNGGTAWESVVNDWSTDYCVALEVRPGGSVEQPLLYAIRQPM